MGPSRSITQALSASISLGKSFSPGMSRVVISNHTLVVMLQVLERLQDGSELARAEILVKSVGKAFEVNVGCVHVAKEFNPRLRRNIARAYRYGLIPRSRQARIGKSRLTAALLERLATEPHTRLRYSCSPQHTDSAFYPIIGQMERAAGFVHGDAARAKLDKLDALLAQTSTTKVLQ